MVCNFLEVLMPSLSRMPGSSGVFRACLLASGAHTARANAHLVIPSIQHPAAIILIAPKNEMEKVEKYKQ